MATKKNVQKRRVQARQRAEAQAAAAARRDRRRRMIVGGIAGTLALAMVASLGIGFLAATRDPDSGEEIDLEPDDSLQPVELRPPAPGAAITGETPCPATDGTQERTISFESPPPMCIDAGAGVAADARPYEVTLETDQGPISVTVDPTDPAAANLFVTNARYGVYDDMPFWLVVQDGLAITGDTGTGDIGFTVPASPAARPYQVGDVIMWANEADAISSQFAMVTSELIAATLNSVDRAHPIVGSISPETAAVADRIVDVAGAPGGIGPLAEVRIETTEVSGPA